MGRWLGEGVWVMGIGVWIWVRFFWILCSNVLCERSWRTCMRNGLCFLCSVCASDSRPLVG